MIKGLLEASVETIADAQEGANDKLIYDSCQFGVLYKNSFTRKKGKWNLFSKNIPPRISIELAVEGNTNDLLNLQNYLKESNFEVLEARVVSEATYLFLTKTKTQSTSEAGMKTYENLFSGSGLKSNFSIEEGCLSGCSNSSKHALHGFINGNVKSVLKARNVIRNKGLDLPIYEEGITFY